MVRYSALIWDMDGTLVDSLPVIYEAFSAMLRKYGREPVSLAWMRDRIGHPFEETMKLVGLGEEARNYYREVYFALGEKHRPFPGVEETLEAIYGRIPMVIISNKSREGLKRTLAPWNGEHWFDAILCEDDLNHPKPHPEAFERVQKLWQKQGKVLDPEDALMIGDTMIDEAFARACGMAFAYASWGYGKAEKPEYVLHSPRDLLAVTGLDEERPLAEGPELDLHGIASPDVERAVRRYLEEAQKRGYRQVRVIPGKGRGVRKKQVESILSSHPSVAAFRESHPLWGGWGSYDVFLKGE